MRSEAIARQGLGGSDIAAILGVDSRRDAFTVWAEKRGTFQRAAPNPRMKLGKLFERGIAEYYSDLTGRPIQWIDETRQHPERHWMVYTPDAICVGERRGVDAKLVGFDQRRLWGDDETAIPARVTVQAHWYLAAMDYDCWDIAALVDFSEPRIYTVERDTELEGGLIEVAEKFWTDCVLGGQRPLMGAAEANSDWLRQNFPRVLDDGIRQATKAEADMLALYAQIRLDEKPIIDRFREARVPLENELKFSCGEGAGIRSGDLKFTWKATKDKTVVDWEPMARALLSGRDDAEALLSIYTREVPGQRRLYFSCPGLRDQAAA